MLLMIDEMPVGRAVGAPEMEGAAVGMALSISLAPEAMTDEAWLTIELIREVGMGPSVIWDTTDEICDSTALSMEETSDVGMGSCEAMELRIEETSPATDEACEAISDAIDVGLGRALASPEAMELMMLEASPAPELAALSMAEATDDGLAGASLKIEDTSEVAWLATELAMDST